MTREEVIKYLEDRKWWLGPQVTEREKWHEAMSMAIEALKTQEWIPCCEKLPEESNIYLCCNIVGDIYMHRWIMPFYFKKEGAWMDTYDDWPEEITDVVAWMPLPEPYKAESEDKA